MQLLKRSKTRAANAAGARPSRNDPARSFESDPELLNQAQFNAQIRRERLRADREGRLFSVALLTVPRVHGQDVQRELLKALAERAARCCRESDFRGLLHESDRLGVGLILPSCTREQAFRVVREMDLAYRSALKRKHAFSDLQIEVWQYPSASPLFNPSENGDAAVVTAAQPADAQRMLQYALPTAMPAWKRLIDLLGAGAALLLFSPFMIFAAIAIRLTSPGPILFRQTRAGHLGRPFKLFKFRTMHTDIDTSRHREQMRNLIRNGRSIVPGARPDSMVKLEDRNQIIPVVGKLLRASCIDELPQLFNTLRGEMSLVGPRPPIPYEAAEYAPWHLERFDAVPGMTGLWQVSGKNKLSFQDMVRLDIQYGRRRSLWLDLHILAATPLVVVKLFVESTCSERKYKDHE